MYYNHDNCFALQGKIQIQYNVNSNKATGSSSQNA